MAKLKQTEILGGIKIIGTIIIGYIIIKALLSAA
jgi:hypothetical protein|tara:strand:+ start:2845 stop:2946 length:102 start_codon:yes stop_codon:yes gene_type:complete